MTEARAGERGIDIAHLLTDDLGLAFRRRDPNAAFIHPLLASEAGLAVIVDRLAALAAAVECLGQDALFIPAADEILAMLKLDALPFERLHLLTERAWDVPVFLIAALEEGIDGTVHTSGLGHGDLEAIVLGLLGSSEEVLEAVAFITDLGVEVDFVVKNPRGVFIRLAAGVAGAGEIDDHAAEGELELAEVVVIVGEDLLAEIEERGQQALAHIVDLLLGVEREQAVARAMLGRPADGVENEAFAEAGLRALSLGEPADAAAIFPWYPDEIGAAAGPWRTLAAIGGLGALADAEWCGRTFRPLPDGNVGNGRESARKELRQPGGAEHRRACGGG